MGGLSTLFQFFSFSFSFPFPVFVDGAGRAPQDFFFAQGAGDPAAEHEKGVR